MGTVGPNVISTMLVTILELVGLGLPQDWGWGQYQAGEAHCHKVVKSWYPPKHRTRCSQVEEGGARWMVLGL